MSALNVLLVLIWTARLAAGFGPFLDPVPHSSADDDLLLPDVLPTGPSLDQSDPVFLEVPAPAYVRRNKPATLTCRAAHALHLFFRCNGYLMADDEHSRADYVDPETAIRQLELKLAVTRGAVESYFGEYRCNCTAVSSRGRKTSPTVKVTVAYLKKSFATAPLPDSVQVDQTVELRCKPPSGEPTPSISWTKNGVTIDPKQDPNYIISKEGNLLIVAAKLSDMANYSCVAENVANRRVSPPARLTVFVDGGWSSWGVWSSCEPACGPGRRQRVRTCDSPRPLNGGRSCRGPQQQTAECSSHCPPVDGGWSPYGDWSACDITCRQSRQRTCSSPSPAQGGRPCSGADREHRNCSAVDCQNALAVLRHNSASDQAARAVARSDVALYVGLAVALVVFPLIALLALKLYRRKGRGQSMYGLTERDYESKYYDHNKKPLSYTPDLTATVTSGLGSTPPSRVTDYGYNRLDAGYRRTGLLGRSEPLYDEPLLPPPGGPVGATSKAAPDAPSIGSRSSQRSAGSSGSAGSRSTPHHSSSSYCSSPTSRPNSLYDAEPSSCRQSLLSSPLPSSVNPDNLEFGTVTSAGAVLSLPNAGVTLVIPEGAVPTGQAEEVYLAVASDAREKPQLNENQTLLSPVILVGPPGTQFLKPVVVGFHHCANLKTSWLTSVHVSESPADETPQWQRAVTLGQETINTPIYVQLDQAKAYVLTDCLQALALVGEPCTAPAVKNLRLAAFGPRVVSATESCVRVYIMDDTRAALDSVCQLERRLGGRMMDKPKTLPYQSGSAGLCVALEDLSLGWKCRSQPPQQEIPFRHVWSGACSLLHVSFSLEHVGHAAARDSLAFSGRIQVYQRCSQIRRQVLRVTSSSDGDSQAGVPPPVRPAPASSTFSSERAVGRLSAETKQRLCQCLNPPNPYGNDWRMLAQMMQVRQLLRHQEVSDGADPGLVGGAASRTVVLHGTHQHSAHYGSGGRRAHRPGSGRPARLTLRSVFSLVEFTDLEGSCLIGWWTSLALRGVVSLAGGIHWP
ncbi:netrin receptor UNC5C-like isoform X2 [Amphibalanus amphitrite]|uniref:netrin receptor UNC5C-like isoform X2 n=1 Tax=Amphibalanus amphitrite TaxID=1232801 RepID=UPI001C905B4A|nr:netrin receptor UNC5C-like isoform X2 [Amphibalanus amphitrite]